MRDKHLVLVFTGQQDPMWSFFLGACSADERKKIILFPTDNPGIARCSYNPQSTETEFQIYGEIVNGSDIQSIWLRRLVPPDLTGLSSELHEYCANEYRAFYHGIEYALRNVLWVSRPSAIMQSRNKSYQLRMAKELGFKTLETIFTNSPETLNSFYNSFPVVYKAIHSPKVPVRDDKYSTVFTTLLKQQHLAEAEGMLSCPGILQHFCKKSADIRVTVFGKSAFAVRIESQVQESTQIDFRVGARHLLHTPHRLPYDVEDLCINLVCRCGLAFGAIDLALLEDGSYIFFEINPNGQWGWLEEKTGLPMRRALIDLLFQR